MYLTVLHMIGWIKMNERSHDLTLNRMLLDVSLSPKKKKNIQQTSDFNLIVK